MSTHMDIFIACVVLVIVSFSLDMHPLVIGSFGGAGVLALLYWIYERTENEGYQVKSAVISSFPTEKKDQLTLDFTPGLTDRHLSLRDCVAAGVYQRGLGRVAIDLNMAPGNLSVQLSEDTTRNFSIDSLERYVEKTGDTTPVMYLVEKFLAPEARPANAKQVQAIKDQMLQMMRQLESLGAA